MYLFSVTCSVVSYSAPGTADMLAVTSNE